MAFFSRMFALGLIYLLTNMMCTSANTTTYNSQKQLCCNGTVQDMRQNIYTTCCGNNVYDSRAFICCPNNKILAIPGDKSGYMYSCCSDPESGTTVAYENTKQSCCNGKLFDAPNACCGDKGVYNTTSQVCCQKFTYDGISTATFQYRINYIADSKTSCCGLDNYDYRKSVCCDQDTITPKKDGMDEDSIAVCCGQEPYDYSKQFCCRVANGTTIVDSAIHDIKANAIACCGTQQFDYTTEVCCDGDKKIHKPEGAEVNAWLTCCGDKVITDPLTQICLDRKIRPRKGPTYNACGKKQYDYLIRACCSTTTVPQVYNMRTHLCCSDGIVTLNKEERLNGNNECCAPSYPIPTLTIP